MSITSDTTVGQLPVTILLGYLLDQAALSAMLNTPYDLHIQLLSVENLDRAAARSHYIGLGGK